MSQNIATIKLAYRNVWLKRDNYFDVFNVYSDFYNSKKYSI